MEVEETDELLDWMPDLELPHGLGDVDRGLGSYLFFGSSFHNVRSSATLRSSMSPSS